MKTEDKELLIKDLSVRVSYNTIVQIENGGIWNLKGIDQDDFDEIGYRVVVWHGKNYPLSKKSFPIMNCKPYLFPLSSMTEEQKETYCELQQRIIYNSRGPVTEDVMNYVNWCYENHLDVNDLIPNDLAIDATGKNIY
jgi:hypothetical protein